MEKCPYWRPYEFNKNLTPEELKIFQDRWQISGYCTHPNHTKNTIEQLLVDIPVCHKCFTTKQNFVVKNKQKTLFPITSRK